MASQADDDQHTIDQYHDHLAAINAAVRRWRGGEITSHVKRKLIADENKRYYGGSRKSPNNGEQLTAMPQTPDNAAVLSDSSGNPYPTMARALKALRDGYVTGRQALDDGATTQAGATIRDDGWARFREAIGAARAPRELFDE